MGLVGAEEHRLTDLQIDAVEEEGREHAYVTRVLLGESQHQRRYINVTLKGHSQAGLRRCLGSETLKQALKGWLPSGGGGGHDVGEHVAEGGALLGGVGLDAGHKCGACGLAGDKAHLRCGLEKFRDLLHWAKSDHALEVGDCTCHLWLVVRVFVVLRLLEV